MALLPSAHTVRLRLLALAATASLVIPGPAVHAQTPLRLDSTRITISGTSNVHAWSATTTTAQLTRVEVASGVTAANALETLAQPGNLRAFTLSIQAVTLHSERDGLDKNMFKALKTDKYPDITFTLTRVEPREGAGPLRVVGLLKIAGVEREVPLDLVLQPGAASLEVRGEVVVLMTDYGISPPKAMLGMIRSDPKVTVKFETVLAIPQN